MVETKKPTESGVSSVGLNNTTEVTLGENKYKIYRLKAGKFYEALKVYMDLIKEITPSAPSEGQGQGSVNLDKLITSMFQSWPEKMIKFITICCNKASSSREDSSEKTEITEEKICEEAYPEQITEAFRACTKLNRVGENLKNFVAPIGELGAQVQQKKE